MNTRVLARVVTRRRLVLVLLAMEVMVFVVIVFESSWLSTRVVDAESTTCKILRWSFDESYLPKLQNRFTLLTSPVSKLLPRDSTFKLVRLKNSTGSAPASVFPNKSNTSIFFFKHSNCYCNFRSYNQNHFVLIMI